MYLSDNNPSDEINIMAKSKLLYWKTPMICIKNQWWRHDINQLCNTFAWACLENNQHCESDVVLFMAGDSSYFSATELYKEVERLADQESIDFKNAEYIWIYARLMAIKNSCDSDDTRFAELQDVIEDVALSQYEYPRELRHCDQYYMSDIPPFIALDYALDVFHALLQEYIMEPEKK